MKLQMSDVKGFVKVEGEITGHQEACAIGHDVLQLYWQWNVAVGEQASGNIINDQQEQ